MLAQMYYAMHDFVLLACIECLEDGLLLSLCFEEGYLLPMLLSYGASPPLDGIIGPKRDELSRHTRSLHLNLCSSKVALGMLVVNSIWRLFYLHGSFSLLRTQQCCVERHHRELSLRPNPHISNLNLYLFSSKFSLLTLAVSLLLGTIFSCTPHPYHVSSSRLHGFFAAPAKSRSTLFLQVALQSQTLEAEAVEYVYNHPRYVVHFRSHVLKNFIFFTRAKFNKIRPKVHMMVKPRGPAQ